MSEQSTSGIENYLDWLTPTMRADYIACEINGKSRAARARERGVEPATVSHNVIRATERLQDIAEERSAHTGSDHEDGGQA